MFPHTRFLLYFVIPVPAPLAVAGLIVYDMYGAYQANPNDRVGHAAHIGGAIFGFLYYIYLVRTGRFIRFW